MIEGAVFKCATGGVRLDAALLVQFPTSTRAFCREACEEGAVKVNEEVELSARAADIRGQVFLLLRDRAGERLLPL